MLILLCTRCSEDADLEGDVEAGLSFDHRSRPRPASFVPNYTFFHHLASEYSTIEWGL